MWSPDAPGANGHPLCTTMRNNVPKRDVTWITQAGRTAAQQTGNRGTSVLIAPQGKAVSHKSETCHTITAPAESITVCMRGRNYGRRSRYVASGRSAHEW